MTRLKTSTTGVAEIADAIRSGALSSVSLVQDYFSRANALDPLLGTYVRRFDVQALSAAQAVDDAVARGEDVGPLAGVPVAVKDFIATREGPTTGQSRVYDPSWQLGQDAVVVARLRAAGAIIMGKTTMTEHAMGRPDPTQPYPIPRNPWDLNRWTGGSSTGTGNGIAAGLFPAGLGTDTSGSVRIPAAMCGITGLKTTHGLVPMDGCLPAAPSLDVIGPMGRSARDCAALVEVMVPDSGSAIWRQDLRGIRIGVPWSLLQDPARGVDPCTLEAFRTATGVLEARGAVLQDIPWPEFDAMLSATMVIMLQEAYAAHADRLRTQWNDYGRSFRRLGALGALLPDGAYEAALRSGAGAARSVRTRMAGLDALATPTWPSGAPAYEGGGGMPAEQLNLTGVWNATGFPAVALPMGSDKNGMPLSLQLVGRSNTDLHLLEIADVFQQATDWHLHKPAVDADAKPAPVPDLDGDSTGKPALDVAYGDTKEILSRLGMYATESDLAVIIRTIKGLQAAADRLTG